MSDYLYDVAKRLVAFDTVSSKSDRDAMEYIAGELAKRGFKTALQPVELYGVAQVNLVAWLGPPTADGLIISGHVDTVPFDAQPGVPPQHRGAGLEPAAADAMIISGHVDTVPFDGQPGWEREPLTLEIAGERIYGRGTTDMKGFIAQC